VRFAKCVRLAGHAPGAESLPVTVRGPGAQPGFDAETAIDRFELLTSNGFHVAAGLVASVSGCHSGSENSR
jgi:hypothetical protein